MIEEFNVVPKLVKFEFLINMLKILLQLTLLKQIKSLNSKTV